MTHEAHAEAGVADGPSPSGGVQLTARAPEPQATAAVPRIADPSAACGSDGRPGDESRVALVVDDDGAVRRVVARQLARWGWHVRAFSNGEAMLRWLGALGTGPHPQLLISDVDMSGLSGEALALVLQHDHPTIAIVLMSGRYVAGDQGWPLDATPKRPPGVVHLGKPYTPSALKAAALAAALSAASALHADVLQADVRPSVDSLTECRAHGTVR